MKEISAYLIAKVDEDLARRKAEDEAMAALPSRGRRHVPGRSTVYSLRLDPEEVAALERRAASLGLKPTVLARNLVRIGLRRRGDAAVSTVVDQLETVIEELRSLIP